MISGDDVRDSLQRAVINACGPYADAQNDQGNGEQTEHHHLFSKGIHLIVDRVTDNKRVLTFFASDGRLFFLIPMGPKTCIGTTDTQVQESPEVGVTDEDRRLHPGERQPAAGCRPAPETARSIIAERVGVRPLVIQGENGEADWVQLSRKHVIEVDRQVCKLPEYFRRESSPTASTSATRWPTWMRDGWGSVVPQPDNLLVRRTRRRPQRNAKSSCCRRG